MSRSGAAGASASSAGTRLPRSSVKVRGHGTRHGLGLGHQSPNRPRPPATEPDTVSPVTEPDKVTSHGTGTGHGRCLEARQRKPNSAGASRGGPRGGHGSVKIQPT